MTSLVACIGEDKGTWGHVIRVIESQEWDSVFVVTQSSFKDSFKTNKNFYFIIIDDNKTIEELSIIIKNKLDEKLFGDVAINIVSGTGKEHTAIISALLKIGVGIRLVILTKKGIKEI